MFCSLSKNRASQSKPSFTGFPPPPPHPTPRGTAQADSNAGTDSQRAKAHEAGCTCSICKLTRLSGASTPTPGRAQKENRPPSSSGGSAQPDSGSRERAQEKRAPPASVEYSRDHIAMSLWSRGTAALAAGQVNQALRMFDTCIGASLHLR